ncbi:MAG: VCBS repeat-containing protein [Lentisphaerae bacterium]|nr:VCBS repeat-containing protein [Lentisphaerota bacterium]
MPIKWRKQWISDETFESAGVFDVDGDGVLDIVSGGFWYQGPDYRKKSGIYEVKPAGEYFDDFSTIPMDVNGDGRMDFITGGWWGGTVRWAENTGNKDKPWIIHDIGVTSAIETTRAWDIDGDGCPEIIPNNPMANCIHIFKLKRDPKTGKGLGSFEHHKIANFPEGMTQGHGLGCGDIAGNGRMDIVLKTGWFEAPADPYHGEWIWHPEFNLGPCPSVPILVEDINGDGLNELVVGYAHNYGLEWWQQTRTAGGQRAWTKHPIDPFNAQYHDLIWADIDGDGKKELVTGKRHRAHCGNEAGEWDDYGIYYFKWTGENFAKQVISYAAFDEAKGCGIHFQLADLRGTGRLDLVAPGKDGLYVFFNEGIPHLGK